MKKLFLLLATLPIFAQTAVERIGAANTYCADAGSTDAYACNLSSTPAAYVTGALYSFKANTANTGAATINFSSKGAKTIVKVAGGITTALADNDIRAGQIVTVMYDGTNMQMQSTLGNAAAGASPAGSGTELNARASASTFGAIAGSANIAAIADPSALVVVPTNGGDVSTTYGYKVVVFNGVGWTLASPETTVQNAASLDGSHFNTITRPTIANASCILIQTTGPTPFATRFNNCDGSTWIDPDDSNGDAVPTLPANNTTAGLIIGGIQFPASPNSRAPFLFGGYTGGGSGFYSNNIGGIAGLQNIECFDKFGRPQGRCYIGFEGPDANGHYYIETDLFQSDEIGSNRGVCTDADAYFKPCAGTSTAPILTSTQVTPTTVSGLGTCNGGAEGKIRGVTDADTPIPLMTVAGMGTSHVPVYCDGTNWIVF